jgi:hypothetical protein
MSIYCYLGTISPLAALDWADLVLEKHLFGLLVVGLVFLLDLDLGALTRGL